MVIEVPIVNVTAELAGISMVIGFALLALIYLESSVKTSV
jgi:hypothetical protein